jgi:hypothetical protein
MAPSRSLPLAPAAEREWLSVITMVRQSGDAMVAGCVFTVTVVAAVAV